MTEQSSLDAGATAAYERIATYFDRCAARMAPLGREGQMVAYRYATTARQIRAMAAGEDPDLVGEDDEPDDKTPADYRQGGRYWVAYACHTPASVDAWWSTRRQDRSATDGRVQLHWMSDPLEPTADNLPCTCGHEFSRTAMYHLGGCPRLALPMMDGPVEEVP